MKAYRKSQEMHLTVPVLQINNWKVLVAGKVFNDEEKALNILGGPIKTLFGHFTTAEIDDGLAEALRAGERPFAEYHGYTFKDQEEHEAAERAAATATEPLAAADDASTVTAPLAAIVATPPPSAEIEPGPGPSTEPRKRTR